MVAAASNVTEQEAAPADPNAVVSTSEPKEEEEEWFGVSLWDLSIPTNEKRERAACDRVYQAYVVRLHNRQLEAAPRTDNADQMLAQVEKTLATRATEKKETPPTPSPSRTVRKRKAKAPLAAVTAPTVKTAPPKEVEEVPLASTEPSSMLPPRPALVKPAPKAETTRKPKLQSRREVRVSAEKRLIAAAHDIGISQALTFLFLERERLRGLL